MVAEKRQGDRRGGDSRGQTRFFGILYGYHLLRCSTHGNGPKIESIFMTRCKITRTVIRRAVLTLNRAHPPNGQNAEQVSHVTCDVASIDSLYLLENKGRGLGEKDFGHSIICNY